MRWSDQDFEDDDHPRFHRELPHSGLGIASFALSLFLGLLLFLLVAIAGYLGATTPGGVDEQSPVVILLGLAMIGAMLFDLVALILGLAALFQEDRKKVFAILGVVFSAILLLGCLFLIVIGILAG
jgi:hypothetical protein